VVGRSTHWLTGLLLLAIAGLSAAVVLELTGGVAIAPDVTAAAPATAAPEAAAAPTTYRPPPERQFDEISDRPLFFPSRRPFVPPAGATEAEATPAAEPAIGLELIGVLLTEHQRAALVQPQGEPAAHWVHEQQTVAGWLVEEIAPDRVRVREGDRVEVVKLRADQARGPTEPRSKPKSKHKRKSAGRSAEAAATAEPTSQ
jgi:Type II secretion system protein C